MLRVPPLTASDDAFFSPGMGRISPRSVGDQIGGVILVVAAIATKFVTAVAAFGLLILLAKAAALGMSSLFVSGLLLLRSTRSRLRFDDTARIEPTQYPENEPDLSGYGYTNSFPGYTDRDIAAAALNKTLASWPKKWRHVLEERIH